MIIELRCDGENVSVEFSLISHRGGKGFGPENTLESLQAALDFGVEMIETDVRMSNDGVAVIRHGPFLSLRLLSRMDMGEIRERAPEIPTLSEYLELAGKRCAVNLDVKRCDAGVLARDIAAAKPSFPVLVSSFDEDFIAEFKGTGSVVELGLLSQYELSSERMLDTAEKCGASVLLPVSFTVSDELVSSAHAAGFKLITWTVNSNELLRDLVEYGVDGVITDAYPELKSFLEAGLTVSPAEEAALPE
jgi:glycerophosphoryl diester phosphodiesterase